MRADLHAEVAVDISRQVVDVDPAAARLGPSDQCGSLCHTRMSQCHYVHTLHTLYDYNQILLYFKKANNKS